MGCEEWEDDWEFYDRPLWHGEMCEFQLGWDDF